METTCIYKKHSVFQGQDNISIVHIFTSATSLRNWEVQHIAKPEKPVKSPQLSLDQTKPGVICFFFAVYARKISLAFELNDFLYSKSS